MGSRGALLFAIAAVAVLAFSVQAGSASRGMWLSRTVCSANETPKLELRCGQRHVWHEQGVVRWIRGHKSRTLQAASAQVARRYRVMLRNHLWLEGRARRWVREARGRLSAARRTNVSHGGIAHEALWLCIHRGEGAWNDNTGNGYYGGLQMTSGWGGVKRPDLLSPYAQMALAERQYAASHYSSTWLGQQWPNTSPPCLQYAG